MEPEKQEFMTIRLEVELKNKIKNRADRERRTMAAEVLYLVERGLEKIEADAGIRAGVKAGKTQIDMNELAARL